MNFLKDIDPKIIYACISALASLIIYAWRKISIETWDAVTRKNEILQTLPAIILSGLMSAAPAIGKPMWNVVANIVFGAVFGGAGAIVGHQVMKASPLPYTGGAGKKVPLFPPEPDGVVTSTSEQTTPVSNPSRKESNR